MTLFNKNSGGLQKTLGAVGFVNGLQALGTFAYNAAGSLGLGAASTGVPYYIARPATSVLGSLLQQLFAEGGPGILGTLGNLAGSGLGAVGGALGLAPQAAAIPYYIAAPAAAGASAAAPAAAPAASSALSTIATQLSTLLSQLAPVLAVAGAVYAAVSGGRQIAQSHKALRKQTLGDSSVNVLTGIQSGLLVGGIAGGGAAGVGMGAALRLIGGPGGVVIGAGVRITAVGVVRKATRVLIF